MIVVLIGPPGAGKSKQSQLLKEREHIVWLSAGQSLRDLHNPGIDAVMNSGEMVDDDFVDSLVERRLDDVERNKVAVLDGFPRHEDQAEWLLGYSAMSGRAISCVIHLKLEVAEARQRLLKRGEERDRLESINERLEEYAITIEPIIDYFEQSGVPIKVVEGNQPVEAVFAAIDKIISDVHQS